ncbi:MAG: NfeD family protein [Planctomycetota bacterium]
MPDILHSFMLSVGGVILILVDLMFVPGGFLIAAGALCMLWAVWLTHQTTGPWAGLFHLFLTLAITPRLVSFGLKRCALKKEMRPEDGYVAVPNLRNWVGAEGVAVSPLRPVGSVLLSLNGRKETLEASAEGAQFLETGTPVRVIRQEGSGLVVTRQEMPATSSQIHP